MPETQASKTLPQYSSSSLKVAVQAVLEADSGKPVDEWLNAHDHLRERPQVRSILGFLQLLTEAWQSDPEAGLISKVEEWRSDYGLLSEELIRRFRDGYAAAGCDERHAGLIGNDDVTPEALGRVLEGEPPFRRLKDKNPNTCGNAIRFARHVHGLIVEGGLVPQETRKGTPSGGPPSRERSGAESGQPRVAPPPRLNDLGTIVNPKSYRVGRVRGDLWVYGMVHFESPQGAGDPNWLSRLRTEEQAQYLEQLAAALLQHADSLRERGLC